MVVAPLIVGLLVVGGVLADYWRARPEGLQATFVGRGACIECHREEVEAFTGSHHDLAMDVATDETVLGDFSDVVFEHDGLSNRLYRDGERFMVHTEGEDGAMQDFEVKYVFGVDPLQQYMVEFDRDPNLEDCEIARLQVLRISWDTKKGEWFYLRPPDVEEKLAADDPLHWTGIAQRWQTMCADCHSTNLKKNFDEDTATYRTTFSEIDVSCEACHGPASLHVELAKEKSLFWDRRYGFGLNQLKGEDTEPQIQTCAPCHSRRGVLEEGFAGGPGYCDHFRLETLGEMTYHGDGQIRDEVYVYGSFIQSKMYHKGIRCTDCHDPHTLKLKHPGNETCTSCHQHAAGKYDVPSHHHHEPGTAGAQCVSCHMPETTYMEVDPRRDHSLRVPRPDLSVSLGTPNACSGCHLKDRMDQITPDERSGFAEYEYLDWILAAEENPDRVIGVQDETLSQLIDQTDQWCDDACEKWYGKERYRDFHFSEALVPLRNRDDGAMQAAAKLLRDSNVAVPAIAKATLLEELARQGYRGIATLARDVASSEQSHPMLRSSAAGVLGVSNPALAKSELVAMLDDDSRVVRTTAARSLVNSPAFAELSPGARRKLDSVLDEVRQELMVASDRAGTHITWATLCERLGRFGEAIESYQSAIRVEPNATGARSQFAAMLEGIAQRVSPAERGRMLLRVKQLRKAELPLLARDAKLAPEISFLRYRYGLALYLDGQMEPAQRELEAAASLEPENEQFALALRLLREKLEA
ncbi:MAG: multiheme c-type cytochrome, partial [Planctomycetota bacterium]